MTDRPAILGGSPLRPAGEPAWPVQDRAIEGVFQELFETGDWGRYEGDHCDRLEKLLAERHNVEHVRLTASGTAAVEYALRGVGVGPGDEVVLAAWDFKANFVDVVALGAKPVLVDIRDDDAQMDVAQVEAAITNQTRAVLASHLHGCAVDMIALRGVCDEHGIALVEDVCQMPLAEVDGRVAGTWGDAGVLSFGGSKTLSAGRGGAVVTNSAQVSQRLQLHDWRGNRLSPLSEVQAAVLVPQIHVFDERHACRRIAVDWLRTAFSRVDGVDMFPNPRWKTDYYKVAFRYDPRAFAGLSRSLFCETLHAEGVTVSPSFPALHVTHSPRRYRGVGELNHAAIAGQDVVVLHHPVLLLSESEWQLVVDAVEKIRRYSSDIKTTLQTD